MDIYNLISFAGIFVLLGFAWLLSATLACLMTACVAGTVFSQKPTVLGL